VYKDNTTFLFKSIFKLTFSEQYMFDVTVSYTSHIVTVI